MSINTVTVMSLGIVLAMSAALKTHADVLLRDIRESAAGAAEAPLLAREQFAQQQVLSHVVLSPDGQHLAYGINETRQVSLWRYDISTQRHHRLITVKQLHEMHWSADSRSVFYIDSDALYELDISNANIAEKRLELTSQHLEFLRPDPDIAGAFWVSRHQPERNLRALIWVNAEGQEHIRFMSKDPLSGFLSHDGQLTVVEKWVDDRIHVGEIKDKVFSPLTQCRTLAPCKTHHWDTNTRTLLLSAFGEGDLMSLFQFDAASGAYQRLHQDPSGRFDLHQVVTDALGEPLWASYQTGFNAHYALDPQVNATLAQIQIHTNSPINWLSSSRDLSVWLVVNGDPNRGKTDFLVYQAKTERWQKPFDHMSTQSMPKAAIAPRHSFWYRASDGMMLHGYITLPLGLAADTVPLVVFPHGGPWSRSQGTFNGTAQFLANRGYAVFEPNFRASTGMGYNYVTSANRDFGDGRVQQDITEGIDHLLAAGIGDPNQQAIVGHSFGGFSAITGLAFTPKRFQVAFAGAAPINLADTMVRYANRPPSQRNHRTTLRIQALMVDVADTRDIERLYSQSPDKHWQRIERPLYLWAGERDDRVPVEGIRDIALRLQANERAVTLLSAPLEGHSPEKPLAREGYLYLLEHALARHVSGRAELGVRPELRRYLQTTLVIDTNDVQSRASDQADRSTLLHKQHPTQQGGRANR